MQSSRVTHPSKPGQYGLICPAGTSGWVTWPDDEWLTTDPPAPGMVVVEWFDEADPKISSDFLWENLAELEDFITAPKPLR